MVTDRETLGFGGGTSDKRADSIKFSLCLNFGKYITDEKLQVRGVALFYIGSKDKHHFPPIIYTLENSWPWHPKHLKQGYLSFAYN